MAFPAPYRRLQDLTAGWRYRNGGDHFAYDYGMPIGTPLYATANGYILDCADGAPNNRIGVRTRRSNWILLRVRWRNRWATIYYQHLSPGLKVKKGQYVTAGQLLGYSGNSGWSTGPHLHIATGWGQWTAATRYAYMNNDGRNSIVLFPPSNLYKYPWGIGTYWYGYKPSVSAAYRWRVRNGTATARDKWWVQQIQAQLGIKVTGVYDQATANAVTAWSKRRGYTKYLSIVDKAKARRMGLPV